MRETVEELLERALIEDRVDFVRVLIDNGAQIDRFLTVGRLRKLYWWVSISSEALVHQSRLVCSEAGRRCPYTWPLLAERGASDNCEEVSLSLIHALIKSFTRRFNDPVYRDDTLVLSSRRVSR